MRAKLTFSQESHGIITKEAGPVSMSFTIPMYNALKIQVRHCLNFLDSLCGLGGFCCAKRVGEKPTGYHTAFASSIAVRSSFGFPTPLLPHAHIQNLWNKNKIGSLIAREILFLLFLLCLVLANLFLSYSFRITTSVMMLCYRWNTCR